MAVKSMAAAVEATGQWRWLRGHFPIPAGCRNRDFYPSKFIGGGSGAAELFLRKLPIDLGFSVWRLYIGGEAASGSGPGGLTPWWHG
jgi:hypothetical protein